MAVYQTNLWICERCGAVSTTTEKTDPYADPVVVPPSKEKWEYILEGGKEILVCDTCSATLTDMK